jgi:hypothetical protein
MEADQLNGCLEGGVRVAKLMSPKTTYGIGEMRASWNVLMMLRRGRGRIWMKAS